MSFFFSREKKRREERTLFVFSFKEQKKESMMMTASVNDEFRMPSKELEDDATSAALMGYAWIDAHPLESDEPRRDHSLQLLDHFNFDDVFGPPAHEEAGFLQQRGGFLLPRESPRGTGRASSSSNSRMPPPLGGFDAFSHFDDSAQHHYDESHPVDFPYLPTHSDDPFAAPHLTRSGLSEDFATLSHSHSAATLPRYSSKTLPGGMLTSDDQRVSTVSLSSVSSSASSLMTSLTNKRAYDNKRVVSTSEDDDAENPKKKQGRKNGALSEARWAAERNASNDPTMPAKRPVGISLASGSSSGWRLRISGTQLGHYATAQQAWEAYPRTAADRANLAQQHRRDDDKNRNQAVAVANNILQPVSLLMQPVAPKPFATS